MGNPYSTTANNNSSQPVNSPNNGPIYANGYQQNNYQGNQPNYHGYQPTYQGQQMPPPGIKVSDGNSCQFCNKTAPTVCNYRLGTYGVIWILVLFFFTAFCCWIPLVMK